MAAGLRAAVPPSPLEAAEAGCGGAPGGLAAAAAPRRCTWPGRAGPRRRARGRPGPGPSCGGRAGAAASWRWGERTPAPALLRPRLLSGRGQLSSGNPQRASPALGGGFMAPSCLFIFFAFFPFSPPGRSCPGPAYLLSPRCGQHPPLRSARRLPCGARGGRRSRAYAASRRPAAAILRPPSSRGRHLAAGQARSGRRHFGCGHGEAGGAGKSVQKALF